MTETVNANGAEIPVIGFGTWDLRGASAARAVEAAIKVGYRHVDTAAMYANEKEVGEGLRNSGTARKDIFLTTKVWPRDAGDGPFQRSVEASLARLKMDQVDLVLIHWPSETVSLEEQVRALCDVKKRGYARHVGVSNFSPRQIEETVAVADKPIVTNQVEHNPWHEQSATFAACAKHGIAITSYSPLAKARHLSDPVIVDIARAKGKTPSQVVLRWHIQLPHNIAIPKSSDPRRIAENFAIFEFTLSPDEMRRITALGR